MIYLILFLGLLLRVTALHFGLPDLYHADEPIVVNHALAYGTWDFNPHFFKIPPLLSYLLFGVCGISFLLGKIFGFFGTVQDFEYLFYRDPTTFYLLGRLVFGAFVGTISIYLLYRLIARYFSRPVAVASAFFLSVCFLHVRDSHYLYPDIPLVMIMVISFWPFLEIVHRGNTGRLHLISGLLIGMATAMKYNGGSLIMPYLLAGLLGSNRKKLLLFWAQAGLIAWGSYFCLNPFSFFDFNFFLKEIKAESIAHPGFPWEFPLAIIFPNAMGWPLWIASVLGMLMGIWKHDKSRLVFLAFIISYYAIICRWGQPYARYGLPFIPFLLFFASDGVNRLIPQKMVKRELIYWGIIVLLALPTLASSILFDRLMLQKDTRSLAKEWIERNIPSGSSIALDHEFYGPPLRLSSDRLAEKKIQLVAGRMDKKKKLRRLDFYLQNPYVPSYKLWTLSPDGKLKDEEFLFSKPDTDYDLDRLKNMGIQYVVTVRLRKHDAEDEFYRRLERETKLVAQFNPYRDPQQTWALRHPLTGGPFLWRDLLMREKNGQPIKIYKINT